MSLKLKVPEDASATPITGTFGLRIRAGAQSDFRSSDWKQFLRDALKRYKVVVLKGEAEVSPHDLLNIGHAYGTPETFHPIHKNLDGVPGVMVLHSNSADLPLVDSWHTDGSTRVDPRCISALQAVTIPDYGRDTVFADMEAAFAALSEPMRTFLEQQTAIHSWGPDHAHIAPVEHPVVLVDPETGRKSLYVNREYTRSIKNMRPDESDLLLKFLYQQTKYHEFLLRVSWEVGTVVIWDNTVTQHYLVLDRAFPRVMHRVVAFPESDSAVQLGTEEKLFVH